MASFNGIVLGLIGFLVIITPLTTEIPGKQIKVDIVSGGILFVVGCASLLWGFLTKKKVHEK